MPNFFEELFNQTTKIHEKTKTVKIKELDEGKAFQKTEETFIDAEQGTRTLETFAIHKADCGHMLHSPGDLKGYCFFCRASLCKHCAMFRCTRCLNVICSDCSRLYQGLPYCRKCKLVLISKSSGLSGLKALHGLMSKRIS